METKLQKKLTYFSTPVEKDIISSWQNYFTFVIKLGQHLKRIYEVESLMHLKIPQFVVHCV